MLQLTTDAVEAARRIAYGLTHDLPPPSPAPPSAAGLAGVMEDGAMVWLDMDDPERRGVFVMHLEEDGAWYVSYAFGPSARWLDYLEQVCDTFIAKGRGADPLRYPPRSPLGKFGADALRSSAARGLCEETALAAKAKISALRARVP